MILHLIKGLTFISFLVCTAAQGQSLETKELLKKIHKGTDEKRDSLANAYKTTRDSLEKTADSLIKKQLLNTIDSLDKAFEENNQKELFFEFEFIEKNPTDPIALEIMLYKVYRRESMNSYDTFNYLFSRLSTELKSSQRGKQLREVLTQINNSKIGSFAPNFTLKDINGQNLNLNSYKNKNYILLDFWASWCVPCRADFPFLKEVYDRYHSKGLEIINISRDDDINAWRQAISKDGISSWRHISTKLNDSKILSDYFVSAIPVKVLIDKDGRIIGRWLGGGDVNKKDLKELLEKYLGSE